VTNAGVDRQVYETIRELDELYLRLRKPEPNVPPRLFHYTDPHGLLGIILSRGLWASNADYLNDSSEPAHALGVLRVAFQQVAGSLRPGSFAERALDGCWDWALNMHKAEGPHVYVFCMSEHDDLLSARCRVCSRLFGPYALRTTASIRRPVSTEDCVR
jgi:hypothetical protein